MAYLQAEPLEAEMPTLLTTDEELDAVPGSGTSRIVRKVVFAFSATCLAAVACSAALMARGGQKAMPEDKVARYLGEHMEAYERVSRLLGDDSYGIDEDQVTLATCVIDVAQSAAYLGTAITWIDKAVTFEECPANTQRGCTVSVTAATNSMLWLASYLSLAASSCSGSLNVEAACAADITAVGANLVEIATDGTLAADVCDFSSDEPPIAALLHNFGAWGRRLAVPPMASFLKSAKDHAVATHEEKEAAEKARKSDISFCVFDAVQGSSYIVRAILQLLSAIVSGCEDGMVCALNILNLVSSFSWAAAFLSFAVGDCEVVADQRAYCAAAITDLVAVTASVTAASMALGIDCPDALKPNSMLDKEAEEIQAGLQ